MELHEPCRCGINHWKNIFPGDVFADDGSDRADNSRKNMSAINQVACPTIVSAVCVEVTDLGVVKTGYGPKPRVRFCFDTDLKDASGNRRRLYRTFNICYHEMSALCAAAKSWTGRDLVREHEEVGEVDLNSFVDLEARLRLESNTVASGTTYQNIAEILPAEDCVRTERAS